MSKKSSEPPLKKPALLTTPSPTKVVLPEWYQKYSQEAFVHDNEFDETKIHSESYDTKIGHLKGKSRVKTCELLIAKHAPKVIELEMLKFYCLHRVIQTTLTNESKLVKSKCEIFTEM